MPQLLLREFYLINQLKESRLEKTLIRLEPMLFEKHDLVIAADSYLL